MPSGGKCDLPGRSMIDRLVIVGVGLIGGSVALALRRAGQIGHIVGIGRTPGNLAQALAHGVIDEAADDYARGVAEASCVLLAVPVGQIAGVLARIAPYLPENAVVTDAGSTKGGVAALARRHLDRRLPMFVPGHPIAGAEQSGVGAAQAALFQGKDVVLTPLPETDSSAIAQVRGLWQACGAVVSQMTPEAHDRVFAAVSHLPHLLSFALVEDIAGKENASQLFHYAASGFRDFTRIAGSSPEMWRDICLANRQALLQELDGYRGQIDRLRQALATEDGAALEAVFDRARAARNRWLDNQEPSWDET